MLTHLLDVSIRSLLLALVAAMLLLMVRRVRTAAMQHAVWTTVVCGMLALFALGAFLPRLPLRMPVRTAFLPAPSIVAPSDLRESASGFAKAPIDSELPRSHAVDWGERTLVAYS